jgi:hypothetical protein
MIAESDKENLWDGSPTDMRFDLLTMTNGLVTMIRIEKQ